MLVSVLDKFDAKSTIPYYLARYCALLGQTNEAKGWITLAAGQKIVFQMAESGAARR